MKITGEVIRVGTFEEDGDKIVGILVAVDEIVLAENSILYRNVIITENKEHPEWNMLPKRSTTTHG